MIESNEITFSSDTAHRKQWFKGLSFSHPAKMHLSLQIYLIERYTKPGDTILDPMFGSGTLLTACAIGRNVIGVELEQKFVDMAKANWEKIKSLGPIMGYQMGTATIIQGDSRQLPEVLADICCFSPPFAASVIAADGEFYKKKAIDTGRNPNGASCRGASEGIDNPSNIGNLKYGEIDKIIYSPPFAAQGKQLHSQELGGKVPLQAIRKNPRRPGEKLRWTNYENPDNPSNIGNLKSASYLEAMAQVYQGCHRVLRDGGLMILVTKNFIRNKKIIRLDLDTINLCENAGFKLVERLKRKLTAQSFWRVIALSKCDNRKAKGKCKLGLSCPTKKEAKALFDLGMKEKQIIERLCPKFANTMPNIKFEDILIFVKDDG